MERLQGLLGIIAILAVIYVLSSSRKNIKWRTIGVGLVLQVVFCFLVLRVGTWIQSPQGHRQWAN